MKNIIRSISVYSQKESEFLLGQILLPELALSKIAKILKPMKDDPEFYYCYKLTEESLTKFLKLIPPYHAGIIKIDFENYEYHFEARFERIKQRQRYK